ncbi:MAG: SMC-Scp complex subunit ScpB [Maricaulaceae bacterium]
MATDDSRGEGAHAPNVVSLADRGRRHAGRPESDADPGPGVVDAREHMRMVEALLFAAEEPLDTATLRARLPEGADVQAALAALETHYETRGVRLARVAGKWRFETAPDLAPILTASKIEPRKLSPAALETLAVIAYHQPATRADIETVRGVAASKGTLDLLMDLGWVRVRGRRRAPGKPVTYGTTDRFLAHFGLDQLSDLPGKADLKAAGLLSPDAPADFDIPRPSDDLAPDEEPIGPGDPEFQADFFEPGPDAATIEEGAPSATEDAPER